MSKVVPKILFLLCLIEVMGPVHEIFKSRIYLSSETAPKVSAGTKPPEQADVNSFVRRTIAFFQDPQVDNWLTVVFSVTAIIMVWHHRRLDHRTHRLRALIGRIVVLLGQDKFKRHSLLLHSEQYRRLVREALNHFVAAVGYLNGKFRFNACLLVKFSGETDFFVFAQDKSATFEDGLQVQAAESVAGCAIAHPTSLVYVPRSKFVHGVRIGTVKAETFEGSGKYVELLTPLPVLNVYQEIHKRNQEHTNSLLCIKVPATLEQGTGTDRKPEYAVLCLSSPSGDCAGDLEFSAIRFFASLLSLTLGGDNFVLNSTTHP